MYGVTDVFDCFDQFDDKVLNDIVVDPHVFVQLFVDPSVDCQSCSLQGTRRRRFRCRAVLAPASSVEKGDLQFHDIEIDFGAVHFPVEFRRKFRRAKSLLVLVCIERHLDRIHQT